MRKSIFKKIFFVMLTSVFSTMTYAQLIAWQFAVPTELTGKEVSVMATTVDPAIEATKLTRGPNAKAGPGNARGFSGNLPYDKTKADARKSGAYYQFVVKVKQGYQVSLSELNVILRRQENSAYIYRWMYSLDGKKFKEIGENDLEISDLSNNGIKQPAINLSAYSDLQNIKGGKEVVFRIYAWGATPMEKAKRAFGFGKSNIKGSKVLWVNGTSEKIDQ